MLGIVFARLPDGPQRVALCGWHKTLGLALLELTLVRIGHRLRRPPPPLPTTMPHAQQAAARFGHRLVYLFLLVAPLTGLAAASGADGKPIQLIAGLEIPTLYVPGDMIGLHFFVAYLMLTLLLVHIGAALWHQSIRRDLAGRMPPFATPPPIGDPA